MLVEALILELKLHSLSVQWSHSAVDSRPAVAVALDTIGYLPVYVDSKGNSANCAESTGTET
jgi:hypothetical protein